MSDIRVPQFPRVALFDDPDEELKLAAFRARTSGIGLPVDEGTSFYFGNRPAAPAATVGIARPAEPDPPDAPYLDYSKAFPRPKPKPLRPPRFADMPTDGPLGPALPRPWTSRQTPELLAKRQENVERIASSMLEMPGAVWRGAFGAVEGLIRTADLALWEPARMLGRWLNERGIDTRVPVPESLRTPAFTIALHALSEPLATAADSAEAWKDLVAERQTAAGVVAEHVTTWLLSRGVVGAAASRAGVSEKLWTSLIQDIAAAALTPTPHAPNAANLADKYAERLPQLVGPVHEFLRADPTDNEALARLKAGLINGGVTGAVAEGMVLLLGLARWQPHAARVLHGTIGGAIEHQGHADAHLPDGH